MSVGVAYPSLSAAFAAGAEASDEDDLYVRRMAADYGLTAKQQRQLRAVLQRRAEEEREVFRAAAELPAPVASALEAVRRRTVERMRALLSDSQRRAYDQAVQHQEK
jgi:hypothetical protein